MRTPANIVLTIVVWVILSAWAVLPARTEPCERTWASQFCRDGISNSDGLSAVYSALAWDDGTGEALYVGGEFDEAGCAQNIHSLARWDGTEWSGVPGFEPDASFGPRVYAMHVFDDGTGPALYVAGEFVRLDGTLVLSIARWDGESWTPLTGPHGTGVGATGFGLTVFDMAVFDDGSGPALYVAGSFCDAGGVAVENIARWDGVEWSALSPLGVGGFPQAYVTSLAVHDDGSGPALYAGGAFDSAGGVAVNGVARWDGAAWSPVPGLGPAFTYDPVRDLAVFDEGSGSALFAAGSLEIISTQQSHSIARWDGSTWSPLGEELGGVALSLHVDDSIPGLGPVLLAGGVIPSSIMAWNGVEWTTLDDPDASGVDGFVWAIASYDDGDTPAIYAGGTFSSAGARPARRIARWDGRGWSALGSGLDGAILATTIHDDGTGPAVFAGGEFTTAGGRQANHVAKWDGQRWRPLRDESGVAGVDDAVRALSVYDDGTGPALYLGGDFISAGDQTANRIAKWDGESWSPIIDDFGIPGVSASVRAFEVFDDGAGPDLYVGGDFSAAGFMSVSHIAGWDGTEWSKLQTPGGALGTSGPVHALAEYDDGSGPVLYAAGDFFRNISRWDGNSWSIVGGSGATGLNDTVLALKVFDDGTGAGPFLFVGGAFTKANNAWSHHLAKWDGTDWTTFSDFDGIGLSGDVMTLEVFDDGVGSGPGLYAGGSFADAGGQLSRGLAKWDGAGWTPLGDPIPGVNGGSPTQVSSLAVFDDGTGPALMVGGDFDSAGGEPSLYMAKWAGCGSGNPCPADLNSDDLLDLADLVAFVTAFSNNAPAADFDDNGLFDLADITAFVQSFLNGCS